MDTISLLNAWAVFHMSVLAVVLGLEGTNNTCFCQA